jgi:hypothetical protein
VDSFDERMTVLSELIGEGDLVGRVVVDQVYARYQHERLDLHHPRGGGPKYLEGPLYEHAAEYMQFVADEMLSNGPQKGVERAVDDLAGSGGVETHAPFEWGDLSRSGHAMVDSNDQLVYDIPPKQHRLTDAELREKARRTPLPPQLLGYIWWHVMHKEHPPNYQGGS